MKVYIRVFNEQLEDELTGVDYQYQYILSKIFYLLQSTYFKVTLQKLSFDILRVS